MSKTGTTDKPISIVIKERIEKAKTFHENISNGDVNAAFPSLELQSIHPADLEDYIRNHKEPSFRCNDNISEWIHEDEKELLIEEVTKQMQGVLESLVIDTENDHNTKDTAKRVAKMMINETFGGRYNAPPVVTAFPNAKQYDQIYIVGPIEIKSTCAHHFQNIVGKCYIGVKPGKDVIGLSKFNRYVDWLSRRPSIQEEMTEQIADAVEEITKAEGVIVFMRAEHMCMTHRGVKAHESDMKTAVVRGVFREDKSLKNEFYQMLAL